MKVNIEFGATESLVKCFDNLKEAVFALVENGGIDALPKSKEHGTVRAIVNEDGARIVKKEQVFPPVEDTTKEVMETEPVKTLVEQLDLEPVKLTEVDVREAMDACRKRIEGEDYATNTKSEGYKKYHRELSKQFKSIAMFLGAEKPSMLPEGKRYSFIEQTKLLEVLEDGTIGTPAPY